MDNLKVAAAIFDVEVKDIMLVRNIYDIKCAHKPPDSCFGIPEVIVLNVRLKPVYAGTSDNVEMIGYGAKCSCGRLYFVEV